MASSPRMQLQDAYAFLRSYASLRDRGLELGAIERSLHGTLRTLEGSLRGMTESARGRFKTSHDITLRSMKRELAQIHDATLRGFHDRIFRNLLGYQQIPYYTDIYEAFLAGITKFLFEEETSIVRPSYHRGASCGPRNMSVDEYRKTHTCSGSRHDIRNSQRIERCYIERLVYDSLFTKYSLFMPSRGNALSGQNSGHVAWLEEVRRDFETCFPGIRIAIEISYDTLDFPVRLDVRWTGRTEKTYSFIRRLRTHDPESLTELYVDAVDCRKQEHGRPPVFRIQSYHDHPGPWMPSATLQHAFETIEAVMFLPYTRTRESVSSSSV